MMHTRAKMHKSYLYEGNAGAWIRTSCSLGGRAGAHEARMRKGVGGAKAGST